MQRVQGIKGARTLVSVDSVNMALGAGVVGTGALIHAINPMSHQL